MDSIMHSNRTVADPPFDNSDADIILISSDDTLFYVHKVLLALVSPVFNTMFTLPPENTQDVYDGKPCVQLSDEASKLSLLLSWCDPRCTTRSGDLVDLRAVLELADKYAMDTVLKHVENFLKNTWKESYSSAPLEMFAMAARFRLDDLVRIAARETLKVPVVDWSSTCGAEHITAACFLNLLQYHTACSRKVKEIGVDFDWLDRGEDIISYFTEPCERNECRADIRKDLLWLRWWLEYMDFIVSELVKRPTASTVKDQDIPDQIHAKICRGTCHNCAANGFSFLKTFTEILAKEVEKRIDEVPFSVVY